MLEDRHQTNLQKHARSRTLSLFLLTVVSALVVFLGVISARIVAAAREIPTVKADAIVIFGAAQYAGHPSPVYKARLDHGYDLFEKGLAPLVITTGGAGQDPEFSEGGVGRDYLLRRGVPEHALIAETQGSDTAKSAARVANIMRVNGMHRVIAVSDAYHVFRIRALLEREGIEVEVAPRPESRPRSRRERYWAVTREAMSYLAWKVGV
jgi:uncharacterized SAM-binding protein YcdF (DUF218 family)